GSKRPSAQIEQLGELPVVASEGLDRKSTRLNSSHVSISYAVFCLKKKTTCRRGLSWGKQPGDWEARHRHKRPSTPPDERDPDRTDEPNGLRASDCRPRASTAQTDH